jgi:hypothetical protein
MSIPFTQFLMPDGRKSQVTIDRSAEIEATAKTIIAKGYTFEIEVLMTGVISMEVILRHQPGSKKDDCVIASELCHNGPTKGDRLGVPESVDKLVITAAKALKL